MSVSKHCTIYHGMFSQLSSCFLSIRVLLLYFQMKAGRNINSGFNNANNLNYRLRNDDHKIMNKMNTNHNSYCHRITNFSSYSRAPSHADRKRLEVCLELNCPQRFSQLIYSCVFGTSLFFPALRASIMAFIFSFRHGA